MATLRRRPGNQAEVYGLRLGTAQASPAGVLSVGVGSTVGVAGGVVNTLKDGPCFWFLEAKEFLEPFDSLGLRVSVGWGRVGRQVGLCSRDLGQGLPTVSHIGHEAIV